MISTLIICNRILYRRKRITNVSLLWGSTYLPRDIRFLLPKAFVEIDIDAIYLIESNRHDQICATSVNNLVSRMARSRFTSRTDFLGGQAARPNATVPDVCLLDVPHPDAGIQVRRYRSISIPPAAAPPTMESILQRLRNDPLEIGWRALNGIGIADTSKGTKTLLDNPCCVIAGTDPGEMTGDDDLDPLSTSSPKDERLLWCFQLGGQEGRLMEECFTGLQGLEGRQSFCRDYSITDFVQSCYRASVPLCYLS